MTHTLSSFSYMFCNGNVNVKGKTIMLPFKKSIMLDSGGCK